MSNSGGFWILGARRRDPTMEFFWEQTGAPLSFTDWASGAPRNTAYTYLYMNARADRKWADYPGTSNNIICEVSKGT